MGHMHTQNSQVFITKYLLLLVVMVFPMPQVLDLIMAQPALCFVWQENWTSTSLNEEKQFARWVLLAMHVTQP